MNTSLWKLKLNKIIVFINNRKKLCSGAIYFVIKYVRDEIKFSDKNEINFIKNGGRNGHNSHKGDCVCALIRSLDLSNRNVLSESKWISVFLKNSKRTASAEQIERNCKSEVDKRRQTPHTNTNLAKRQLNSCDTWMMRISIVGWCFCILNRNQIRTRVGRAVIHSHICTPHTAYKNRDEITTMKIKRTGLVCFYEAIK